MELGSCARSQTVALPICERRRKKQRLRNILLGASRDVSSPQAYSPAGLVGGAAAPHLRVASTTDGLQIESSATGYSGCAGPCPRSWCGSHTQGPNAKPGCLDAAVQSPYEPPRKSKHCSGLVGRPAELLGRAWRAFTSGRGGGR